MEPSVSVIIPVLNEAAVISQTIEHTKQQLSAEDEIIIVDGGSSDSTVSSVQNLGLQILKSPKGRAIQMNQGARSAKGDILLFLHADTRLPAEGICLVKESIRNGDQAGRFRLRFDASRSWSLKFYASYTRFHSFSYGDQAFFVTRKLFDALDGFREDVPFEDLDFYARLKKINKPRILKQSVITSARRFNQTGAWKQKWINILLVSLYYAGADIEPLKKRWYPDIR